MNTHQSKKKNIAEALTQEQKDEEVEKQACERCEKEVISEERMIECELCELWICQDCHQIDKSCSISSKGLHWVCQECDTKLVKLMKDEREEFKQKENETHVEKEIEQSYCEELKQRIRELEEKMEKKNKKDENKNNKEDSEEGNKQREKEADDEQKNNKKQDTEQLNEKLKQLKKENKKKDTEINKLKKEVNKKNSELDKTIGDLRNSRNSRITISNLNNNIKNLKEINKKLELKVREKAEENENSWSRKKMPNENFRSREQAECRNFARRRCQYGSRCRFKHAKKLICKYYTRNGYCSMETTADSHIKSRT